MMIPKRNQALDGVRGLLALTVLIIHAVAPGPLVPAYIALIGGAAVCAFFALSGLVLTRAWNQGFIAFLARRFVRLWPVYALCLGASFILAHHQPIWTQFFWWPLITLRDNDPPAWSLCIEAWAMLAMPFFVWCGRGPFYRALIAGVACLVAADLNPYFFFGIFFIAGAWLSRFELRSAFLESAVPQWLGHVSYPLYLSHYLVLRYLGLPLVVSVPLALLVAAVLTETVEKWSISTSRRVGHYLSHGVRPARKVIAGDVEGSQPAAVTTA